MNSNDLATGLGEIGQIGITVSDLERATAFYRDKLGLKLLFTAPPGLAFFAAGSVRLMLSRPEASTAERFASALYFKVADLNATRRVLGERGVAFEAEPHLVARMPDHELWMAFCRDPDRNLIGLMCEKRA